MIQELIGCYVLVGTRTRRVGTSGHSTESWCWQVLASSCNCIRVQRSLEATWRPKACFGLGGAEPTFRACRSWMVRSAFFERKSFLPSPIVSRLLGLPTLPPKWASRMLRAMHAPDDNPLTANRRWVCYVDSDDNAPGEMSRGGNVHPWTLVKGFQNPESNFDGVVYSYGQRGRQNSSGTIPTSTTHPRRSHE